MTLFPAICRKHLPTWINSSCISRRKRPNDIIIATHSNTWSTKTVWAAVRQKCSNWLSCLIPHRHNCGTVCCVSAGTSGEEASGSVAWLLCVHGMRGTLISVSGYCLNRPQKGQKGHMTSWDISCNNATFLFLNSCLFVMLLSVSTVVVHSELTYRPTQHFLLILPVHRWMRMEFKHTIR